MSIDTLRALVAQWREEADTNNISNSRAITLHECADELEAAFASTSPVGPVSSEQWQAAIEIHVAYVEALEAEIERLRSET